MKNIYAYFFSLLILGLNTYAQEQEVQRGIRLGIDLSRYGFFLADKAFLGNEITLDYNWKSKNFIVLDVGQISGSKSNEKYSLQAGGIYSRIGIDHNFLPHPSDVLSIGTRLGFSRYQYRADEILFSDPFWGDYTYEIETQKMGALWIEAVFGVKTEILKNVYLGWSVSAKVLLFKPNSLFFPDYKIPGYGSRKGSVSPGFGFYFFYKIPFRQKATSTN
jgi:hypothetical protein